MKPKKIILLILLFCILGFIYYFYIPGRRFPQVKSLIILDSGPEPIIPDSNRARVIDSPPVIELINKSRRIRVMNIVKTKVRAKAVTVNNDTIDIVICIPGGHIVNMEDKKKYGFINTGKQKKLFQALFSK